MLPFYRLALIPQDRACAVRIIWGSCLLLPVSLFEIPFMRDRKSGSDSFGRSSSVSMVNLQ